jgi:hypothetical protein
MRHAYDERKAIVGDRYVVSGDSFDPSALSSSTVNRNREQRDFDDYTCSMPAIHMFGEDTSSDSRNGFENLVCE